MKVLVAGATGGVGKAVVQQLVAQVRAGCAAWGSEGQHRCQCLAPSGLPCRRLVACMHALVLAALTRPHTLYPTPTP